MRGWTVPSTFYQILLFRGLNPKMFPIFIDLKTEANFSFYQIWLIDATEAAVDDSAVKTPADVQPTSRNTSPTDK